MNRQNNNVPFKPVPPAAAAAAAAHTAAPVYTQQQQQLGRIPHGFRDAMTYISMQLEGNSNIRTSDMVAKTQARKRAGESSVKWKSSFKPVGGEEEDDCEEKNAASPERTELYNPYEPGSSDSEQEIPRIQDHNRSLTNQDNNQGRQRLSPIGVCPKNTRWDISSHDLGTETRPTQSHGLSTGHTLSDRRAYSPETESLDPPGYRSISRPLDHRVCSPERLIHSSSTQRFPASYGGQRTNMEERIPEYRREMATTVRLSPPRLQRSYQHQLEYAETEMEQISPSTDGTRNKGNMIIMDKNPITCDLCDVELSNGQELEDHLESKSHWDTLEHIQEQNNYDDLAIAFLQEVMLYKSRQCSRAIDDRALQALQENDHMTKIEMFHCAACKIFVSTSAASVQSHITSQEHLSNTKEFEVEQRHTCLSKAETMMKELKPQFEHFLKGGSPFE